MLLGKQIREIDYWAGTYWCYSWKAGGSLLMLFVVIPLMHFFCGGLPKGAWWVTIGLYAVPCGMALAIHQVLYWRRLRLVRNILTDGQPSPAIVVAFTMPTNGEYPLKIVTESQTDHGTMRTTHSLMAWQGIKEFRTGDEVTLLRAGSHALLAEYFVEVPADES